jgi:hypothetical protein
MGSNTGRDEFIAFPVVNERFCMREIFIRRISGPRGEIQNPASENRSHPHFFRGVCSSVFEKIHIVIHGDAAFQHLEAGKFY